MDNLTLFKEEIYIGEFEGEKVFLASPSWDCGWYWGFGYIQNSNLHTHFSSIGSRNKNMFDNIKDYFPGFIVNDDEGLWEFCELMQTFYNLKKTTEVLGRGGSHYKKNPIADIIKNEKEAERINKEVLPKLFDKVYELLKKY